MQLYNDDCLSVMKNFNQQSIDLILCDLPYAITKMKQDSLIPLDQLLEQYNRIIKSQGKIILFSSSIFTIDLINSNRKNFKYKLIWEKNVPTGMSSAKYRPMKYYI